MNSGSVPPLWQNGRRAEFRDRQKEGSIDKSPQRAVSE
jgi:hypothetical protein